MHPTIADVLARPEVRAGSPVVRAGRAALGTAVRWVHVSEVADPAGTLPAGVLVLSVGVPVADPTTVPARYVDALRAAGAVGLVVEIGQQLPSLPAGLVQAARAAGFPLVELRRTVRFAEIVAGVLEQVVDERGDDEGGGDRAEAAFRALALHRVAPGRVVDELARRIDAPVVCEDLAHRVLLTAGTPDLRDWVARSRLAGPAGPEGWAVAPVGRPDARWGRLAVPSRPAPGTVDRVGALLAAAADAVSLLDPDPQALLRSARDALLADLAAAVPAEAARLAVRARAAGLDTTGPLSVVALRPTGDHDPGQAVEAAVAAVAPGATTVTAGPGELVVLVPGDGTALSAALLPALPAGLAAATAGPGPFTELPELLRRAREDASAHTATGGRGPVRVPALRGMVHRLGDDPRLLGFAAEVLGPLAALPAPARTDARDTLWALVEAGGVVTDVARRLGLGRPAAYARLRRLSALLGLDLTDPEARTALHLALLVDARVTR
ncbi:PucR family transcriptional regulator [Pseudonocardia sp. ICBG1293]|uniref:PucR family transcriptional regulator n=1 Tax=Pseudonocardia sp. ICBG1293 TaxID=2844382 RepID=UPI001CCADBFF|nr:PucR family transcriptional regulator [Pseudonocardia sp. ICBG1293]